ncbi:MAG: cytochrome c [Planctomycetota bacterium]
MRSIPFVLAVSAGILAACGGPKPLSESAKRGRDVYLNASMPKCGQCHKLNDAGTIGVLGPDLDKLRPRRDQVLRSVRQGVGVMPKQIGVLTDGQMEDVASYVAEVAGRRP